MKINNLFPTICLASLVIGLTGCGGDDPAPQINEPPIANISTDADLSDITVGATIEFTGVNSTDADGTVEQYIWNNGSQGVVDSYTLTTTAGQNSISLIVVDNSGLKSQSKDFSFNVGDVIDAEVDSITIVDPVSTVFFGSKTKFHAEIRWDNNSVTNSAVWSVDNTSIATINSATGKLTANAAGTVKVMAEKNGKKTDVDVKVQAPDSKSLVVSPSTLSFTALQQAKELTFTAKYQDGTHEATPSVSWICIDDKIASASDSTITALADGSALCTATWLGKEATVNIKVDTATPVVVNGISVSPNSVTLIKGGDQQLNATVSYSDLSENTNPVGLIWSCDDTAIATVSNTGLVSEVDQGTTQCNATLEGKSASSSVKVKYDVIDPNLKGDLTTDINNIWKKSPGFYKEGQFWYAIVHAPASTSEVKLAGDFTAGVSLQSTSDGEYWWFEGTDQDFDQAPQAGDKYMFYFDGNPSQDPAARDNESSWEGSSSLVTISSNYHWNDSNWSRPAWDYYQIYQLHPSRFTNRNFDSNQNWFNEITEELNNNGHNDYINKLGPTAIELLPINEFAGDVSWGYNPSYFYAPESAFGSPDDLKKMVDTAHQNGIAVILDLVFNHAGPGDNILWDIDDGVYFDGQSDWGNKINFDHPVSAHFFAQNVVYLAKEYHIDGFRFDHTLTIHGDASQGGWDFLKQIRKRVKELDEDIILIAEELPDNWYVTNEVTSDFEGDMHGPFDSQWTDEFHDTFKSVLTGGNLNDLDRVFKEFGDSWHDALNYTESHDEVGNTDDRIAKRARDGKGWEMGRISVAGTFLSRGIPMMFMGQEAGEEAQFHINWWSWTSDPQVQISDYEDERGKMLAWTKKINEIRKADSLTWAQGGINITHINDANGIAAFTRDDGKYAVVMNFKGSDFNDYDVGISGNYKEIANTSWPEFNLGGSELSRGKNAQQISGVDIPAYGVVILERE